MPQVHELVCGIIGGCYILTAWSLAIAASSMMIYQVNSGSWVTSITRLYSSQQTLPTLLLSSWAKQPFVGIKVLDAEEYPTCPSDYPEDVVYDIWLGTRAVCDCLENAGDRIVTLDIICYRGDD